MATSAPASQNNESFIRPTLPPKKKRQNKDTELAMLQQELTQEKRERECVCVESKQELERESVESKERQAELMDLLKEQKEQKMKLIDMLSKG